MNHIDNFLSDLNANLPAICTDKDLVNSLPDIFKSHGSLVRMRQRGEVPHHFYISPNIYYLKEDVLEFLKKRYSACTISN